MRLRHLRYWRCFFFGHIWTPILDKELQPIYGSGGYRCSRCPFGSGSKEAFLKYMKEITINFDAEKDLIKRNAGAGLTDSKSGVFVWRLGIDPAAPKKRDE